MKEKSYGLPIVAFNIDYSPCFNSGVILVEMFDYISMAKETIKLLQSYDYRKKKGKEAKLSLKNYINNNETIDMWDKLFNSLMGYTDFKEFQNEVEKNIIMKLLQKQD